ncbi:hypothetical protein ACRN9A_15940 [Shewanella frigidimarina]|uniref:hypothetical protein n=1 Tax=Shewanella frigidimarina TaxID=56812 RepID=UPI003D7A058D
MRLSLIAVGIILMSANAHANTNLGQQLSICAAKTDKTVRLTCYDELAANVEISTHSTATATSTKITATEELRPTPAPVTHTKIDGVNAFGLSKKALGKQVEKIYSEVLTVKKGPYGKLTITLSNGQVWKQNSPDRYQVKKGQRIFIATGALNSFLLGSDDRNSTTRVRRLK